MSSTSESWISSNLMSPARERKRIVLFWVMPYLIHWVNWNTLLLVSKHPIVMSNAILLKFTEPLLCSRSCAGIWGVRMSNLYSLSSQGAKEVSTVQHDECSDGASLGELEEWKCGIQHSPRRHSRSASQRRWSLSSVDIIQAKKCGRPFWGKEI